MASVAVVILAEGETHESLGRLVNGLITAKECKEAGDAIQIVFDGGGTKGLAEVSRPDHRSHRLYSDVEDVIAGACRYCAGAFGVKDELERRGIPLLDDFAQHPSLRSLIAEGYHVITF